MVPCFAAGALSLGTPQHDLPIPSNKFAGLNGVHVGKDIKTLEYSHILFAR